MNLLIIPSITVTENGMIKGAFIDYKIRRPQLRDDGPLINTNALFQASIVLRGIYATWCTAL